MFDVAEPDPKPAAITPAHILAEAAADTGAAAAAQPGASPIAEQPAVDPAKEAADLIEFARSLLLPLYPRLEAVYTPEVCGRLGAAAGPLMAKYGLTLGGLFDRWAPEIGFAIVALPLVRPTIEAIRGPGTAGAAVEVKTPAPGADAGPARVIEPPAEVKPSPLESFAHGLNPAG